MNNQPSVLLTLEIEALRESEKMLSMLKEVLGRDSAGAREVAVAFTKLQEARMWLEEALKEASK